MIRLRLQHRRQRLRWKLTHQCQLSRLIRPRLQHRRRRLRRNRKQDRNLPSMRTLRPSSTDCEIRSSKRKRLVRHRLSKFLRAFSADPAIPKGPDIWCRTRTRGQQRQEAFNIYGHPELVTYGKRPVRNAPLGRSLLHRRELMSPQRQTSLKMRSSERDCWARRRTRRQQRREAFNIYGRLRRAQTNC